MLVSAGDGRRRTETQVCSNSTGSNYCTVNAELQPVEVHNIE